MQFWISAKDRLTKAYKVRHNSKILQIAPKNKSQWNAYFAVYGFKNLCEISKLSFEISHKILIQYPAKCAFQSFEENFSLLYFSGSGLNLLKMIDLKPSNIIWTSYTAYRQLETIHMRSKDTNFFLCVQLYVKIHTFCVPGRNFQLHKRT